MNRNTSPSDDSWESDAIWKLLDQAPPKAASTGFANDVLRAVRLAPEPMPWWSRLFSPAPVAGFAAACAALTIAVISFSSGVTYTDSKVAVLNSPEAVAIQDIAETEALIAAIDQLDDLSDNELVSLIGF